MNKQSIEIVVTKEQAVKLERSILSSFKDQYTKTTVNDNVCFEVDVTGTDPQVVLLIGEAVGMLRAMADATDIVRRVMSNGNAPWQDGGA